MIAQPSFSDQKQQSAIVSASVSTSTRRPRHAQARSVRPAHLIFTFSLVSAALARIVMQILGTKLLDADVANAGVAIAAVAGVLASLAISALRDREGWRHRVWALVPIVGAVVGMVMQGLLLMNKPDYRIYVIADGISSNNPIPWVLIGAPFGAFPALVAGALLYIALHMTSRTPSHDARERMLVPLAGGCAILHAVGLSKAEGGDLAVVLLILGLSLLALGEVFFADRGRASWIRRLFAGDERSLSLEAAGSSTGNSGERALGVPLIVGGITPSLIVIDDAGAPQRGYRHAAREPFAAVAATVEDTLAPLLRRRAILAAILALTSIITSISLLVR